MNPYNQTQYTSDDDLKFFTYQCDCCNKPPKPNVISSTPSYGVEFVNMYGLPTDRKWLIESQEGNLMGVCSNTDDIVKFNIIDDTYIIQIPSILYLKHKLSLPTDNDTPAEIPKPRFKK